MTKKILFKKAQFLLSALREKDWPNLKDPQGFPLPEIAFIGRSNVGKSSLINHLLNIRNLAKVSSKPGKTQMINFFLIDNALSLVDLPGYGYAHVSQSIQKQWAKHLDHYLNVRTSLKLCILLLDSRRTPSQEDLTFLKWANASKKNVAVVLTKIDKLRASEKARQLKKNDEALKKDKNFSRFPMIQYSIKEGKYRKTLIDTINNTLWDSFIKTPSSASTVKQQG